MGPPPDCCAHVCDAELGNGVQKMVSCNEAADVLRFGEGAEGQAAGLVKAQRFSCVHHKLHTDFAGARLLSNGILTECRNAWLVAPSVAI